MLKWLPNTLTNCYLHYYIYLSIYSGEINISSRADYLSWPPCKNINGL